MFDLVVVPDGSDLRKQKGAELLLSSQAKFIFATWGPGNSLQYIYDYYNKYNIPGGCRIAFPSISNNTWDDGDQTRGIMNLYGLKSAIIVVSGYELVRCYIIFHKDLLDREVKFVTVPDSYNAKRILSEAGGILRSLVTT